MVERGRLTKSFGDKATNVLEEENQGTKQQTSSKGIQKKEAKAWNAQGSRLMDCKATFKLCPSPEARLW